MANLIYFLQEADILFAPAAAADSDVTFEIDAVATAGGHQSAQKDLGVVTTASPYRYFWRAFMQFQATPTLGERVDIYLKLAYSSSASHIDNDDGTTDAAVSAIDKLNNLKYIGSVVVDEAAANIPSSASGIVEIYEQFVQVVFWNASGATTTTDVDENGFILAAIPDEIQ